MLEGCVIGIIVVAYLLGMLHEFTGAVMLIIASSILIFFMAKNKKITIRFSVGMVIAMMLCIFYLLATVYALDRGMAVFGIIRYVWIIPALLCYQQTNKRVLDALPWIGTITVIVGGIGYFIPPVKNFIFSSGRFGGMFNYPNVQAIFLLLCVIWMADKKELRIVDYIRYAILLAGIAMTGSRIVMVLTVMVVLYLLIRNRNIGLIIISVVLAAVAVGLIMGIKDLGALSRITRLSASESTFVGRLLYYQDAMPLLIRYPFGMGYLGYYYIQNSIQTGWYSVMYIHNDLLQIGLDLGILPMIAYLGLVIWGLFSKGTNMTKKVMIAVLFAHGMLDFDMTFSIMMLIMCILLDDAGFVKTKTINLELQPVVFVAIIFIIVGGYICVPTLAEFAGNHELANSSYPWYTQAKLALLADTSDPDEAEKLADEILAQNKTCSLAYYGKAMVAFINDDYDSMIRYEQWALDYDYFNVEEYENFASMLVDGVNSGDEEIARVCYDELYWLLDYIDDTKAKLSEKGKAIKDQPGFDESELLNQLREVL